MPIVPLVKAVNLLPSDQKGSAPKAKQASAPAQPSGGATGAFAVLGALAFAVLATASYVMVGNTIKDREADLARIKADTQVVQQQLSALKPYADFQIIAAQRVATVTQLAQGRFDWERALRDLSRAIPSDVRLKSLKGSTSTVASGGNALRSERQAPAIELSGCADTQADVARLMSRLRIVRGVTRVALSKSEKPAVIAAGQAPADASQALLCGKGRPPAFEMVVFFERAQVLPTEVTPGVAPGAPAPAAPGSTGSSTTPPANGTTPQNPTASTTTPSTTGVSAP